MSRKRNNTEENSEALDLSGCLTTEESEVDLSIETDFLADEESFEVSDGSEDSLTIETFETDFEDDISDALEEGFNDDLIDIPDITDEDSSDISFDEQSQYDTPGQYCYSFYEVITELAKFGQSCTCDKQRDAVLDIMWMCAMNNYN